MSSIPQVPYTPYPVPTPYINQPNVPGYSTSQAIQQNNAKPNTPVIPQGFVANPYYSQGGSNPQFASPADVKIASTPSPKYQPQQTRFTESELLGKGLDVNEYRNKGLLIENQNPGAIKISENDATNRGWDANKLPSGYVLDRPQPSQEDLRRQAEQKQLYDQETSMVDSAYGDTMGIYDGIYNNRAAQKDNYLGIATSPYDAQIPLLQTQKDAAIQGNMQQRASQDYEEQNAIASARRRYSELNQGVKQRFGGTNSAGEFAQQFYGREFQKQLGEVQNTHGKNISMLQDKASQIEAEHAANLKTITFQRDAAKAQAQIEFQKQLDEISQAKGQIAQAKAERKIQALLGYKQSLMQTEQQFTTFAQQMALQKQAQQADLEKQARQLASSYTTQAPVSQYKLNSSQPISNTASGMINQGSLTGQVGPRTEDNRTWLQKLLGQ